MIRALALLLALLAGTGAARASDAADLLSAMTGDCLVALELGTPMGEGLTRADPAMEAQLLQGKQGRILRTGNPAVVVVAHDSGNTCEVMGLNIDAGEFGDLLRVWAGGPGAHYTVAPGENIRADAPGGAYLVTQLADGEFVQVFIQSQTDARFIGITANRTPSSAQARQVLGLE